MNAFRLARPWSPIPMRVSSVCAHVPMFGVSVEWRYGIGLRHIGIPCTSA